MSAAKKTKKTFTKEQKTEYAQQKREEQRQMLEAAVEKLCTSDGWQRYLDARARFHNYSFHNTILIALQRPEATQVASAKKWKDEFSRTIIKGEKAIKIFAPVMVYAKDEAGNVVTKTDAEGKERKVIDYIWYKTVPVFDVSQTEGDPVPAVEFQSLEGESHEEYMYRAEQFGESLGYTIDYNALVGTDSRGDINLTTKLIRVNGDMPVNGRVRTLIHELCHGYGNVDYTDYTRQQAEVIVESAAYMICNSIGLDTSGMSVPYIAAWGQDKDAKQALATLKGFAGKIDELATAIEEAIS